MNLLVCLAVLLFTNISEQETNIAFFINTLGMEMILIEPGEFHMGNDGEIDYSRLALDPRYATYRGKGGEHPYLEDGPPMASNPLEWDESPSHMVRISRPFYMASTPVTNAQYEQFDPEHAKLRGNLGFSSGDNDAVLFVSWNDAVAFTEWLSEKEGETYRLPTEAEWEYAARANTKTTFHTGITLPEEYHQDQILNRQKKPESDNVNLLVARNPPNAWGLFDIHGLVEEWCYDWYGPYTPEPKTDPVGRVDGVARVTRGGSHSTGLPYLRSANRAGALPETRNYFIGFRVVKGELPDTEPLTVPEPPRWAQNVSQHHYDWSTIKLPKDKAIFKEPRTYTRIPEVANGPLYFIHNHNVALTALPNGDLLAVWFTTVKEQGREMLVVGSRLRQGNEEWDKPDVFFHVPDRNQTGQALWWDGNQTIYYFGGVGSGDYYKDLSIVIRTSTDNGATWSRPRMIYPEFGSRQQVIDVVMQTSDGEIILACDGGAGTVVHISKDGGQSWADPGLGNYQPRVKDGNQGPSIAGIHAGIVELNNGRLMALGRGEIKGQMPMSVSNDKGNTWTYSTSPFPPIGSRQRLAFLRLNEGPLLLVSFNGMKDIYSEFAQGKLNAKKLSGKGMFAALSFDEGKTWPIRKLITPGDKKRLLKAPSNYRWGEQSGILDSDRAEAYGYLTATQTADGIIHILSSGTHYAFNLNWLMLPHEKNK